MLPTHDFELPNELVPAYKKARKLEIITLVFLLSIVGVMLLASGSSQAMKTAWVEDVMSMIPAISFLVASSINNRIPNKEFPYGYHRIFSVAFLTGAVALFGIGVYLLLDSAITLIKAERASIGSVNILGVDVWLGWMMILALLYSAIPPFILGRMKLPLAKKIHNKILYTDADTQKADWMTALTGIVGIILIGFGFWWADAAAALIISLNIISDGIKNMKNALKDIMDAYPRTVTSETHDPLIEEIIRRVNFEPWVKHASARLRENGQVYFGEIFVVPTAEDSVIAKAETLKQTILGMHWKVHDVSIVLVDKLPASKPGA